MTNFLVLLRGWNVIQTREFMKNSTFVHFNYNCSLKSIINTIDKGN